MIEEAWIVFDLGFGDAGKGATVDFLVRKRRAGLVVRFNGGAQAGHNVVTPGGRHHTFSQFGSGSFVDGVRTLLGPDFVLHPGGMLEEERHLRSVGVGDAFERTALDARALVVTPFQQAAGRLRELLRGEAAHGSCGLGVGEAVGDALAGRDDVIRAAELGDPETLRAKLAAQRARKRREVAAAAEPADRRGEIEWELLADERAVARTLASWGRLAGQLRVCAPEETREMIRATPRVVFEGAQGVLLDQDWGFHPHTTWSDCTPGSALSLLDGTDPRVYTLGVTRPYMIRHGPGPLPTADPAFDAAFPEPHNDDHGWQGPVRRGGLDLVLLRYAIQAAGRVDGLALTCLDKLDGAVPICTGYDSADNASPLVSRGEPRPLRSLPLLDPGDLPARSRRTRLLGQVAPRVEEVSPGDLRHLLARALGLPVWIESEGPTYRHRRLGLPLHDRSVHRPGRQTALTPAGSPENPGR